MDFAFPSTLIAHALPLCRFVSLWSCLCSTLPSAKPRGLRLVLHYGSRHSFRLPPFLQLDYAHVGHTRGETMFSPLYSTAPTRSAVTMRLRRQGLAACQMDGEIDSVDPAVVREGGQTTSIRPGAWAAPRGRPLIRHRSAPAARVIGFRVIGIPHSLQMLYDGVVHMKTR